MIIAVTKKRNRDLHIEADAPLTEAERYFITSMAYMIPETYTYTLYDFVKAVQMIHECDKVNALIKEITAEYGDMSLSKC